jgi:3-oxoacyl-[acyl-carrier protein] reductase
MAVALIIGGSRGIGAATAARLAHDGHDVAIAYRANAEAAEQVADLVAAIVRNPYLTNQSILVDGGIRPS